MKNIKAVIFDMDGTILDTESIANELLMRATAGAGFEPTEKLLQKLKEQSGVSITLRGFVFSEEYGPDFDYNLILNHYNQNREQVFSEIGVKIKPGFPELFEYLQTLSLKLAICTNTQTDEVYERLKSANINASVFSVITCKEDVEKPKPHPDGYLLTCKKLGLNPHECLVIEDSATGVTAAHQAGCKVIMIPENQPGDNIKKMCVLVACDMYEAKDYIEKNLNVIQRRQSLRGIRH